MKCPYCGTVLGNGVSVCPTCHTYISNRNNSSSSQQPPSVPTSDPPPPHPTQDPRQKPVQPLGTRSKPTQQPPVVPHDVKSGSPPAPNNSSRRLLIILLSVLIVLIAAVGIVLALLLSGLHRSFEADPAEHTASEAVNSTDETAEIAAAAPTPEPVHTYEVVQGSVSWSDACELAEAAGGYLITVNSEEEEEQAITLAEEQGLEYIWLGGYTTAEGTQAEGHWITGEEFTYSDWMSGEPSHTDLDSVPEDCIMLWKIGGEWSWNDQRDSDLSDIYGLNTRSKMGYIIEYEQ